MININVAVTLAGSCCGGGYMNQQHFLACARTIGVDRRIAALIIDCDRALADLAESRGHRWRARVEDQRQRLLNPDLRTIAALTTNLAEETPSLAPLVAAAMKGLIPRIRT